MDASQTKSLSEGKILYYFKIYLSSKVSCFIWLNNLFFVGCRESKGAECRSGDLLSLKKLVMFVSPYISK